MKNRAKKEKKPFFQTKIGGIVKGAIREIPVIGGVVDNLNSETGGKGKIVKTELAGQLVIGGIILVVVLRALNVIDTETLKAIIEAFESH